MVSVYKYLKDTGDTAPHVSVSVSKIHFKSIFPNLAPYERGRHVWKPSNGTHIRPLSFPCFPAASLILLPPSSALNTYHEIRTNCYAHQGGRDCTPTDSSEPFSSDFFGRVLKDEQISYVARQYGGKRMCHSSRTRLQWHPWERPNVSL